MSDVKVASSLLDTDAIENFAQSIKQALGKYYHFYGMPLEAENRSTGLFGLFNERVKIDHKVSVNYTPESVRLFVYPSHQYGGNSSAFYINALTKEKGNHLELDKDFGSGVILPQSALEVASTILSNIRAKIVRNQSYALFAKPLLAALIIDPTQDAAECMRKLVAAEQAHRQSIASAPKETRPAQDPRSSFSSSAGDTPDAIGLHQQLILAGALLLMNAADSAPASHTCPPTDGATSHSSYSQGSSGVDSGSSSYGSSASDYGGSSSSSSYDGGGSSGSSFDGGGGGGCSFAPEFR